MNPAAIPPRWAECAILILNSKLVTLWFGTDSASSSKIKKYNSIPRYAYRIIFGLSVTGKIKNSKNRIGSLGLVTQKKAKNADAIADAPMSCTGLGAIKKLTDNQKRPPVNADTMHKAIKSGEGSSLSMILPMKYIKRRLKMRWKGPWWRKA